jgi:DNA-directed RNA polymerase specialized sigma24 family protein
LREERVLTEHGFSRLLEWLDDGGADSNGGAYLEMRRRLVSYFDRRNRPSPDELADETLNRIARTLEEHGAIAVRPPARFCYVTAKFVLLEDVRNREHANVPLEGPRGTTVNAPGLTVIPDNGEEDEAATKEQRLGCLERCLETLKPEQRELIVDYYRDARREKIERRRDLAKQLGISMNALAIRACRIRDVLEACVEGCCKQPMKEPMKEIRGFRPTGTSERPAFRDRQSPRSGPRVRQD